jgi:membrane protein insertase Oxa1/YidC/SpoIIIJ
MFIVIRANRLLKESRVGKIELIEQPWNGMGNHWEYLILVVIYLVIQVVSTLLPIYLTWISDKKKDSNKKKAIRKQVLTQLIFFLLFLFIIFKAPSGLTFYWIFTGFLQILQILFFYFYNLKLKQKTKKEKKNIVYQF